MAVDPIVTDLQYVMETGQELDVLNFHKSFPITCKASVEKIDQGVVSLRVQPPGSVCLEAQDQTIILSRGLPEAVKAQVVSFDLVSGLLNLSDFTYVGSRFGDRMIARVQPEETVRVEITAGDRQTFGTLVDVSLSGVGLLVSEANFQRGQTVELTLPLPEGEVNLPGKILNVSEAANQQNRLSIGFTRNAQEIAVVMRYIKDRRSEILNEIERMYERAYRLKKTQTKDRR
jgi:hypothetical protein